MASEDSVKNFLEWSLSLLAFMVHLIGKPDNSRESLLGLMGAFFEEPQRLTKPFVVFLPRRKDHIPIQKRNDLFRNRSSRRDGVDQHIRIPVFWENTTGLENFRCDLEDSATVPVLVKKKFRIDVVTKRCGWMRFYGDTNASFSLQ